MPYLFQYSIELLSANPNASFVNLDSPINVIQLIFWVAAIMIVTAAVASKSTRFSIKWRVADRVEENYFGGHPMMAGNMNAAPRQAQPTFTRRSWPMYAFFMAIIVFGAMFWADTGGNSAQDRRQFASYSQEQPTHTHSVSFVDEAKVDGQQFFNQAPQARRQGQDRSVVRPPNNSQQRPDQVQEVQFASTQPEIRFVDNERPLPVLDNNRHQKGNGVAFTVQLSVGSVESFVQSNAKKIAQLLPKERVYMYPEPGGSQIKTYLGVFTDKASAEAMLQQYRAASGSERGFVTSLPVEESQLYVVPG
ncbi:MAG: hypothetical protein AAFP77_21820 [Bacteroidota bacterium]